MSALNGDRARFRKDRRRKLLRRQRLQALVAGLTAQKILNEVASAQPAPIQRTTPPGE